MRNIVKTGSLFLLLINMMACKDSFLDSYPSDKLTSVTYYTTENAFVLAVNGIYNALHEYKQNQDYFPMLEMATPCATMGGYTNDRFVNYEWGNGTGYTPSASSLSAGWWPFWWRGIRRACDVITNIETKGNVIKTPGLKNRLEGEARFLRAYNYFYLTYFYGDVPYIAMTLDSIYPHRAPHAEIVEYMLDDLTKAVTLLPSVKAYRGTADVGRASKGSALALLGKIYCYEKRWIEAETTLKELVATNDYKLNDSFVDQFVTQTGENSDESIFEIQYIAGQGDDRCSAYATFCGIGDANIDGNGAAGYGYNEPTEYLTDMYQTKNGYDVKSTWTGSDNTHHNLYAFSSEDPAFDPANSFANRDPRLMYTVMYEGSPYLAQYFPKSKFKALSPPVQNYGTVKYIVLQTSNLNSGQNHVVIRYADVLLLLAEALMEQGQSRCAEAAGYVNMVRDRASVAMPHVSQNVIDNQSLLRDYVRKERIRELAMEYGHVFMDLHRWGIYALEMNNYWKAGLHGRPEAKQANFTSTQDLWPIPQGEIDLNPNLLPQNPGY
jgi:starch-binding outer membrane protein, SusD/RagB family